MGDWSEWSKCSADCSLGEPFGEETRQRTLREGLLENQEPEIETRPCREFCKPGKAELEIEEKFFFSPDCSKIDLSLRQVTKGPVYEMNVNLTRPTSNNLLSSVILVRIFGQL